MSRFVGLKVAGKPKGKPKDEKPKGGKAKEPEAPKLPESGKEGENDAGKAETPTGDSDE